ncbi:hypothetical protein [Actinocatenispora comari]|uniref:Uncharacterized protein n=1 Tax=Actinocatenispora comari TaxID=2807577 RepID=A0A8J4AHX3_9ACTN|nr:hypothetical protein [Actinocatenispora comari]GIL29582.1 hypothetical protein NUM_48360 [Actinocatenispora comari]
MSYHDYRRDDPPQGYQAGPQPPGPYQYGPPARRRPGDGAAVVARVVVGLTCVVAVIFGLHVLFSLADANQGNGFVQFVYDLARVLVLGFGDVFTPDDAKIGLVLNYGLAAIIYLAIGQFIAKMLRR